MEVKGIWVPLITPFFEDGTVDLKSLRALAESYVDMGVAGLLALGTTGEPATLSPGERKDVVATIADVCDSTATALVVGAGTNSTSAAIEMTRELEGTPRLVGVLSVVPYYTRPSEEGIVAHFGQIAEASSVPLVLYNIPYRTGRGLGAGSLLQLARMDNIAALKQAVGGIDADTLELMANKPQDFQVLCGDDPFIYSLACLGGSGAIAASAHVNTTGFVQMVDACDKGDYDEALRISNELRSVCQKLFTEPSPSVLKGVLHAQGRISSAALRLPMTTASSTSVKDALAAVEHASRSLG